MNTGLQGFNITRFEFPRDRRIGDSQVLVHLRRPISVRSAI